MSDVKIKKIHTAVRESYAKIATSQNNTCGCSVGCCQMPSSNESLKLGYSNDDLNAVPEGANLGLGCGNPQAIADLKEGEIVLDLGSGAGFDCFLASNKVGEKGFVFGVDMTPEMLEKAKENAIKGNYTNVEFKFGQIENIPLENSKVDVIISNCVINLSPDKQSVFNESYRVLKEGGRLAVSDIVSYNEIPADIKEDLMLYSGCVSGASSIDEITKMLQNAGFKNINIKTKEESKIFIANWFPDSSITNYIVSATIEAVK